MLRTPGKETRLHGGASDCSEHHCSEQRDVASSAARRATPQCTSGTARDREGHPVCGRISNSRDSQIAAKVTPASRGQPHASRSASRRQRPRTPLPAYEQERLNPRARQGLSPTQRSRSRRVRPLLLLPGLSSLLARRGAARRQDLGQDGHALDKATDFHGCCARPPSRTVLVPAILRYRRR